MARALSAAVRNSALYPPEHPTVRASVERLASAIRDSTLGAGLAVGVTPDTLMIEGVAADAGQSGITEAAAMLHERDIPEQAGEARQRRVRHHEAACGRRRAHPAAHP